MLALLPGAHLPSRTAATNLQLRVGMVLGSLQLDDGGERGERGRTHAEAALRGVAPCHAATSSTCGTCGQPTPCAMLRVGSRLRAWRSGEPFVFDPSFEHEMRNGGNETVLLLLMVRCAALVPVGRGETRRTQARVCLIDVVVAHSSRRGGGGGAAGRVAPRAIHGATMAAPGHQPTTATGRRTGRHVATGARPSRPLVSCWVALSLYSSAVV